jgi:ABC-type multidrug transport system ATPase subunit
LRSDLAGPFNLLVQAGEILAVTGASGSGKSLFLRMLADLDVCDGDLELNGRSRLQFTGPQWRRSVIYVPAEPAWWSEIVTDHFTAGTVEAGRQLAKRFGIGQDQFDGVVSRLSTGERQRLALVRAFVLDPEVLLLDEPTAALDPAATLEVERYLFDYSKSGGTVIIASHNLDQVRRLASRHCVMRNRRLEAAA